VLLPPRPEEIDMDDPIDTNDLNDLRRMRAGLPGPTPTALAAARARLTRRIDSADPATAPTRRRQPLPWRSVLAGFGLSYGCFDFAIGADGTWWYLECNAAGQWAWLEDETGLPMSRSFANLLAQGDTA
jgi:hypothetical protein